MDDNSTDEVTGRPPAERAPDGFAVFEHMLRLIADPQAFAERMAKLKRSIEAAADGEATLATDRAAFEQYERATRAELEAERVAIDRRRVDVHAAEGMLSEREKRLAGLEKAWRDSG